MFRMPLVWVAPLALVLVSPVATPVFAEQGRVAAGDDVDDEDEPRDVASVKIEIKQPSGKVLKYDGAILDWGADGNVTFKADDHVHDVSLRIDRANEKATSISLTVGYTKDGEAIIAPHTVDSEMKKREVIRIEGGLAIAITVTKKVTKEAPPEEPPKKPKERIEDPGGENPLDGVK